MTFINELIPHALPPFALFFIGALLAAITRGLPQKFVLIATPIVSFINLLAVSTGDSYAYSLFGLDLNLVFADRLAMLFGYLFHIAGLIGVIYALHVKDKLQHIAALAYAGSAIGAVFSGDWITLFLFWEGLALSSVFLILARRTDRSFKSAMRYLVFQVLSGVLLFGGALMLIGTGEGTRVQALELIVKAPDSINQLGVWLIFAAIGIKAGFPLVHTWIVDAYPEATVTGTVFLSAFTTKVAVYALARCFAGTEILVPIGLTMACFPIFFAVIENDVRRVLSYSTINQVGFIVCGIGLGSELAINGAVAHAFNDVFFKGVLMMSMGAVLLRTGTINSTDLGGLYKSMPKTALLSLIGVAAISAVPLFNGFVSKAIIMSEMLYKGHTIGWLLLLFAAASAFYYAGIRVQFSTFFSQDSGRRVEEAPTNMLIAMTISACFCVGIGCFPDLLYRILPYKMDYSPYDATHILTQLQLLFFSALGFVGLQHFKLYPPELRATNIDSDVIYRKAIPSFYNLIVNVIASIKGLIGNVLSKTANLSIDKLIQICRPYGVLARGWGINNMVYILVLFFGTLLFFNLT